MMRANAVLHDLQRSQGRTVLAAVLAAGMLAAGVADAAATRIYRTVDENGNVVFTDVPPKSDEQGRAVDLNESNVFSPQERPGTARRVEDWLATGDERVEAGDGRYVSLSVASPADDEPLRDNAGNVSVAAALQPDLQAGHTMQLYLDGELHQSGRTTSFQLNNVERGTHTVELRVVNQSGSVVAASAPSTFHLQRRSVLLQPAGGRRSN